MVDEPFGKWASVLVDVCAYAGWWGFYVAHLLKLNIIFLVTLAFIHSTFARPTAIDNLLSLGKRLQFCFLLLFLFTFTFEENCSYFAHIFTIWIEHILFFFVAKEMVLREDTEVK